VAEPDQGWESWLNQVRQHQPNTPIPPDAPTGSTPAQPVGTGPGDSVPISASSSVPAAPAPDVQHVAAAAATVAAPTATIAPAFTAPAASMADSAVPMVLASPPVSSVFSDAAGVQPLAGTPPGGSVFATDSETGNAGFAQFASYGWYIVPSVGNDPSYQDGPIGESTNDRGFADAGYASDWFFFV
jgi:hypothetical protein